MGDFLARHYTVTDKRRTRVGAYSLEELVRRWQTGELTIEQAIGQMLLLLKELDAQVRKLELAQFRKEKSKKAMP